MDILQRVFGCGTHGNQTAKHTQVEENYFRLKTQYTQVKGNINLA